MIMQPARSKHFAGSTVLITGGLGFIGSNLARVLVSVGAHVTLVDSLIPEYGGNLFNVHDLEGKLRINLSDVRDPYSLGPLMEGSDYVFNLAGQTSHVDSMTDPYTDLAINTTAQIALLEACRRYAPDCRIIYASTRQVYGKPEYLPVDELHPVRPVDANGINKWAGESYHRLYADVYGLRTSILRLTNTYGPGMRIKDSRQTFLGVWIKNVIEGAPVEIYGDGRQLRDFNYVDDVVGALLLAAQQPDLDGSVMNLGGGGVWSLAAVAEMLLELEPRTELRIVPYPLNRQPIDIGDYFGSIETIGSRIGWSPSTSLIDGLGATLAYYRAHYLHYIDKDDRAS